MSAKLNSFYESHTSYLHRRTDQMSLLLSRHVVLNKSMKLKEMKYFNG